MAGGKHSVSGKRHPIGSERCLCDFTGKTMCGKVTQEKLVSRGIGKRGMTYGYLIKIPHDIVQAFAVGSRLYATKSSAETSKYCKNARKYRS